MPLARDWPGSLTTGRLPQKMSLQGLFVVEKFCLALLQNKYLASIKVPALEAFSNNLYPIVPSRS